MSQRQTIGFSYQIEGVTLQTVDEQLRITNSFITRDVISQLNEKLKEKNFKVDESSLRIKYTGDQLYVEGFAMEIQEAKTVGFLSGR